jgi:type IV pilus assembly protein PilE
VKNNGFTLMELMIVLVILAVLTMVALPAYENSVIKSNRVAGRGVLLDVASRQEQYFINNKTYTDLLTDLGLPANYYVDNQADQVSQSAAIYRIDLTTVGGNGYTVSAVPLNRQTKDSQCQTLTLNGVGVKTESGTLTVADCW